MLHFYNRVATSHTSKTALNSSLTPTQQKVKQSLQKGGKQTTKKNQKLAFQIIKTSSTDMNYEEPDPESPNSNLYKQTKTHCNRLICTAQCESNPAVSWAHPLLKCGLLMCYRKTHP